MAKTNTDAIAVWEEIVREAEAALEQTPEMLPVLKKAGVVDAGGKGLLIVFEGMLSVLRDGIMIEDTQPKGGEGQETDDFQDAIAQYDADITFAYCTEFIVQKKEPNADSLKLRAYLESIGDSVVVVDDEDIIKCHVHTNNPGLALEEAVKYGMLCKMKIENMEEQVCRPKISGSKGKSQGRAAAYVPVDPEIPYGIVAVARVRGCRACSAIWARTRLSAAGRR